MTIFITSCLVAIVVSFLCSLAEAVLLSLNPMRLETLKQQGRAHAGVWLQMRQNVGRPIAAILILNTIAHTGGATVAGGEFDELYGDDWLWLFSSVFTLIILFGTEIIPKVIGVAYNEQLAPWIAPVLRVTIVALRPVIFLTELLSKAFKPKDGQSRITVQDIRTLAHVAASEGVLEPEQEEIILNATTLRTTSVASTMIPREWIIFLKAHDSLDTNFGIARNNLHTRYPISESDSVDDIVGYVNFKEMAMSEQRLPELTIDQFVRPVLYVSSEANLNTMLKLFIAKRHHLAIVKDKNGLVLGMITLEDVIEEIAGDIEDEFDQSFSHMIHVGAHVWRVGGSVRMDTLLKHVAVHVEEQEASQTLDQWLRGRITVALHPGVTYAAGGVRFTAHQVRRGRVYQAIIETVSEN
jgi:CBS domain containing-hemolysin-like protein